MTNINDWLQTWTGDHCDSEGGGGGGDTVTKWHVIVNCPALEGYYIAYNAIEGGSGDDQYYDAFVDENGHYYFSYLLLTDDGLSNKDITFAVIDDSATVSLYMNEPYGCSVSVTGSVEFVSDEGWNFNVTGDGTITITET